VAGQTRMHASSKEQWRVYREDQSAPMTLGHIFART
jgi:hypothetical protein